jgi:hypothetical protein
MAGLHRIRLGRFWKKASFFRYRQCDLIKGEEPSHGYNQTVTIIQSGHPLSREEAHRRVHDVLRQGLRDARYLPRDFYAQDGNYTQQLPTRRAANTHHPEDWYGQQHYRGGGGVPASGEAIMGLPETIAKEGECRSSIIALPA